MAASCPIGEERVFALEKADQIANFADYCNHCGNCDTFCPEYDGPYLKKPNFYGSRRAFEAGAPHDGFLLESTPGALSIVCRISGHNYRLDELANGDGHRYFDGVTALRVSANGCITLDSRAFVPDDVHWIDVGRFHAIVALLRGITDVSRVHAVNTPLLALKSGNTTHPSR